jgi:hypothetical protein
VTEWGHLLAYLPKLKARIERRQPRVILLPPPHLSAGNEVNPRQRLNIYANEQGRSVQEIRGEAEALVRDYLAATGRSELFTLVDRAKG